MSILERKSNCGLFLEVGLNFMVYESKLCTLSGKNVKMPFSTLCPKNHNNAHVQVYNVNLGIISIPRASRFYNSISKAKLHRKQQKTTTPVF